MGVLICIITVRLMQNNCALLHCTWSIEQKMMNISCFYWEGSRFALMTKRPISTSQVCNTRESNVFSCVTCHRGSLSHDALGQAGTRPLLLLVGRTS